ncbi:hypothetical protein PInf_025095 [Phytophthora infestans]|nr:hypothetical protein PInf_025095 [Phytophthora infestans]
MRSNEIIDKTFPGKMVLILQITLNPGHVYHNIAAKVATIGLKAAERSEAAQIGTFCNPAGLWARLSHNLPTYQVPKRAQWPPAANTPPPPPVVRTPPRSPGKPTAAPPSPVAEYVGGVDAHSLSVLQRRASAAAQYNSTIHEVKGTAGGLHSYSEEETAAFTEHINNTLQADSDVASLMPISTDAGLFRAVCDGVLLCKLLNRAVPETID